jgi:DNA-binding beta-propeller fold protein YncE
MIDSTHGPVHAPEFPTGLPWLNAARPLGLRTDLSGSFVLLDFWTYGCIYCLHLLDDLKRLEKEFADVLQVVGVHVAKYPNEGRPAAVRSALRRYDVQHAVIVDERREIRDAYAVRAWPSLILIDPLGYVVSHHSGERAVGPIRDALQRHVNRCRSEGSLQPITLPDAVPEALEDGTLSYPGGIAFDERGGRLYVADTNHHRILEIEPSGRVRRSFGLIEEGFDDGSAETARFRRPHGLAIDPRRGALLVADTGNHAIRSVDLHSGVTRTIAGTGARALERATRTESADQPMNSPWDVLSVDRSVFVAMAGSHEIWSYDVDTGRGHLYAGSGIEGRSDQDRLNAHLAQPSALTSDGTWLFFTDSESSSIRRLKFGSLLERIDTLVGDDLFDFGDVDGMGPGARLQHPLGLTYHKGLLYVADTYNHKIKRLFPDTHTIVSYLGSGSAGMADGLLFAAQFDEPSALAAGHGRLYVADTNNHAIRVVDLAGGSVGTLALTLPPVP